MAYANAHVKVTIFGTSCSGAEEWSTGFHIGQEDSGGGNFAVSPAWVDALKPLWSTFFTHIDTSIGSHFWTTGIKAGVVLPDGKYDLSTIYTSPYTTPISGNRATAWFPPQVALVAQLRAASPVGLGSKGRMYLPGVCHPLQANGKILAADALDVANNLKTFLDAAEAAVDSPGYVINASKGRPGVPFTAPVNRRVTTVRVGDVYDTQRRRRNGLSESYSSSALVA